jgi:hypothetical protein
MEKTRKNQQANPSNKTFINSSEVVFIDVFSVEYPL